MRIEARSQPADLPGRLADAEFALKEKLVAARQAVGLSQADVAKKLGQREKDIAAFERLDSNPRLSMIRCYAHAIGALVTFDVEVTPSTPTSSRSGTRPDQW